MAEENSDFADDVNARLEQERVFGQREGKPNRSARERVEMLLDSGSFLEVGLLARDTGHGRAAKTPTDAGGPPANELGPHTVGSQSADARVR